MRKILGTLCVVIVLSCAGFSEEIQKKAIVEYLKGIVKITKKAENEPVLVKLGTAVYPGDKIETWADSRVELKMEDGSNLRIGNNTMAVIEEMKQENGIDRSVIRVMVGHVWINIKKLIDGRPMNSVIIAGKVKGAVKGTTYRADVDKEGEASINVYDGAVAVTKDGREEEVKKLEKVASKDFLKARFDEAEDANDDWVRWNKNRDKIRIMIVFTEKRNGQVSLVPLSEVIFAEELLKNYLYSVIDQAALNQIRDNEKLKAALSDDKDGKKAAVAGLEFGADVIITGQVDAIAEQTSSGYGMYTGIADMQIRVVQCYSAELVSAKNSQKRIVDPVAQGAFNNAVRRSSAVLVESINNDIIRSWKKENTKGASLYVSLYNVTLEKIEAIMKGIAGISGAQNVSQISFVGRRALLSVTFNGDSLSLAEKTAELNLKDTKLDVVGVSMNRIEIEVK